MELWGAIVAAIASIIAAYLKYKSDKNSDTKKKIEEEKRKELVSRIEETEKELIKAMETNITDVPGLRNKLETLRKALSKLSVIAMLSGTCLLSGCFTTDPVVVGERVFYVKPNDVLTVPALKSPAKQWYLIDDVAMLKVLGIDKPVEPSAVTGKIDESGVK